MAHEHDITSGPFRLEMPHGGLWLGARIIALHPRSRAILRYLVKHPSRLVTKAELHQQVWAGAGGGTVPGTLACRGRGGQCSRSATRK